MKETDPSSDLEDDLIPLLADVLEDSGVSSLDLGDLPIARKEIIAALQPKLEHYIDAVADRAAEKIERRLKEKLMHQLPGQLERMVDRELIKRFGKG